MLPGYVVGAGGCVEGATVAVILKEERTSGIKRAPSYSEMFCRLFSTSFPFFSLNVHIIVGQIWFFSGQFSLFLSIYLVSAFAFFRNSKIPIL